MEYKLLYIEDNPSGSIKHALDSRGFDVKVYPPDTLENAIKETQGYDMLLLDFRLTDGIALFDAPTIAQTFRTTNSHSHLDIPIVLISSEDNIKDYYRDYTSQDLFDYSLRKVDLQKCTDKYAQRFKSIISAYHRIKEQEFQVTQVLSLGENDSIDYRIVQKLEGNVMKDDVFAYSNFILSQIVKAIGILIGEDVLSARLGVSKDSEDWIKLLELVSDCKYKGVFSDSYDRW